MCSYCDQITNKFAKEGFKGISREPSRYLVERYSDTVAFERGLNILLEKGCSLHSWNCTHDNGYAVIYELRGA